MSLSHFRETIFLNHDSNNSAISNSHQCHFSPGSAISAPGSAISSRDLKAGLALTQCQKCQNFPKSFLNTPRAFTSTTDAFPRCVGLPPMRRNRHPAPCHSERSGAESRNPESPNAPSHPAANVIPAPCHSERSASGVEESKVPERSQSSRRKRHSGPLSFRAQRSGVEESRRGGYFTNLKDYRNPQTEKSPLPSRERATVTMNLERLRRPNYPIIKSPSPLPSRLAPSCRHPMPERCSISETRPQSPSSAFPFSSAAVHRAMGSCASREHESCYARSAQV